MTWTTPIVRELDPLQSLLVQLRAYYSDWLNSQQF